MKNSALIGLLVGTLLGAVLVEGYAPASELVGKSKRAIKDKMDSMSKKNSY